MKMMRSRLNRSGSGSMAVIGGVMAIGAAGSAAADIAFFRGPDEVAAWEEAAGSWGTMDFTGFEFGQHLTDEYEEELGVVFTDTTNYVSGPSAGLFPRDKWGLQIGPFASFAEFTTVEPIQSLAFFHPGIFDVTLWLGDELILFEENSFFPLGFFGFVSEVPFDRVRISDGADTASIDDILVGAAVPSPAVAALLGLGLLKGGRRRRR